VRDAEALQRQLVIDVKARSEIRFEQLAIDALEGFDGERLTLLG
jgi:hypothetical protein